MSTYATLPEQVRVIIDRNAQRIAQRDGIKLDQARELLASRVRHYKPTKPTHGTGH